MLSATAKQLGKVIGTSFAFGPCYFIRLENLVKNLMAESIPVRKAMDTQYYRNSFSASANGREPSKPGT